MNVTVATWNVLADCYAHGHARSTNSAAKSDTSQVEKSINLPTSWNYRKSLIDKCLGECTADIICLQEVDHFTDFYEKCLEKHGYRPMYYQRPTRKDGCAIAFKPDKFELLTVDRVCCDDSIVADSLYEYQKYEKHNVGLSLRLRTRATGKEFVVCTCHVHWNPALPDVKVSQALYLLQRLKLFRDGEETPVIFTGDFNTLREDVVYKGITHPDCITSLAQKLRELRYGGALYGPKTRFLCDASLSKLCKWMRVLGVNVALDAWDNGVPASSQKNKNKSKWQWSCTPEATGKAAEGAAQGDTSISPAALVGNESSTSASPAMASTEDCDGTTPTLPPKPSSTKEAANNDPSYAARVNSINAFFARAEREKRVILTTSKSLRERASCPRNFYVNPQDLEAGLIDICAQFGLELSRDRFLTVCGKCGDEVEEVSREDPRLEHRYLPTDRAVFACVNCAQPYWWNEKAGSLPAKAMEKAEELFSIVCAGQQQRALQSAGKTGDATVSGTAAEVSAAGGLAVVSSEEYALYSRDGSEKTRVKAGTCILKDFGRTAKNPVLKDLSCAQSFSKRAEWELEQERLRAMSAEAGEPAAADPAASEPTTTSTTFASPSPASLGEDGADSAGTGSTPDVAEDVEDTPSVTGEKARITMGELSALFENRQRVLQEQKTATATGAMSAGEAGDGEAEVTVSMQSLSVAEAPRESNDGKGILSLRSVFAEETRLTNWNGDFKGTLDYIFVSEQWRVCEPTAVYPAIDTTQSRTDTHAATLTHKAHTVPILLPAGEQSPRHLQDVFRQVLQTPQPSLQWPSDHLMVYSTLELLE